ncbi:hypothetical protein DOS74_03065 [Staphylococcus felis]|uniref:Uncharacterized protein n=1 Tax=Staphylococcus felis TaxID=46127 RepID=A0A3E0IEQ2_9STAP|nr:hypothetical protein [Staphylococcus felis]REH81344.1 hypothetical protein DOS56_10105 [Staphylococcus felis]REH82309.1 hypothetical protein DOS61_09645 [Staphylococcus felis]REH87835.1 hypothetical protein DOS58_10170 [Staphylococcus felis]REH89002.1 hypothetical protein DOS83_13750 [Staphylococcus felis]REI15177.1 hypothetical protein DOS75_09955 [Staphylococcus felis]
MKEYVFKDDNIAYSGGLYHSGDKIVLTDEQANAIKHVLEPFKNKDASVNYDDMTTTELKKIVEEKGLNVIETGKNGAIKADYIKALEK